jgi:hypothetical protein
MFRQGQLRGEEGVRKKDERSGGRFVHREMTGVVVQVGSDVAGAHLEGGRTDRQRGFPDGKDRKEIRQTRKTVTPLASSSLLNFFPYMFKAAFDTE